MVWDHGCSIRTLSCKELLTDTADSLISIFASDLLMRPFFFLRYICIRQAFFKRTPYNKMKATIFIIFFVVLAIVPIILFLLRPSERASTEACARLGEACGSEEACCTDLECFDGKCCSGIGALCLAAGDCCGDATCAEGRCSRPCQEDSECGEGRICQDGQCIREPRGQLGEECPCEPGLECVDGKCIERRSRGQTCDGDLLRCDDRSKCVGGRCICADAGLEPPDCCDGVQDGKCCSRNYCDVDGDCCGDAAVCQGNQCVDVAIHYWDPVTIQSRERDMYLVVASDGSVRVRRQLSESPEWVFVNSDNVFDRGPVDLTKPFDLRNTRDLRLSLSIDDRIRDTSQPANRYYRSRCRIIGQLTEMFHDYNGHRVSMTSTGNAFRGFSASRTLLNNSNIRFQASEGRSLFILPWRVTATAPGRFHRCQWQDHEVFSGPPPDQVLKTQPRRMNDCSVITGNFINACSYTEGFNYGLLHDNWDLRSGWRVQRV